MKTKSIEEIKIGCYRIKYSTLYKTWQIWATKTLCVEEFKQKKSAIWWAKNSQRIRNGR